MLYKCGTIRFCLRTWKLHKTMPSNLHPILMQAFEPLNSALNTYGKTSRFSINKQHTSYLTLYIYTWDIWTNRQQFPNVLRIESKFWKRKGTELNSLLKWNHFCSHLCSWHPYVFVGWINYWVNYFIDLRLKEKRM